jgi:hypothetical protein
VDELLAACHRSCCICHRFCGVKIETDHIKSKDDGGPSTIDNAIPVCFECHAEIHSYNDRHPRGRKFRPEELLRHKEQWLEVCRNHPEIFNAKFLSAEVGPLQALIDELEFNAAVAAQSQGHKHGCLFLDEQFRKAISLGSIATLCDELKKLLMKAYVAIGQANQHIISAMNQSPRNDVNNVAGERASASIATCETPIREAHLALLKFLGSEEK